MDYDKLIEHLRECGTYGFKQEECRDAALAIEALRAGLARVTAERDDDASIPLLGHRRPRPRRGNERLVRAAGSW